MLTPLPIDNILEDFKSKLAGDNVLILSAEPGAGKTTRIPVAVAQQVQGQVWVLEPRRIAAIAAAHRIAEENGWSVGQDVGYHVRFDNSSSQKTKILFLTEALLFRRLLAHPDLSDVGCVILDEFHERSIHVDLALAALKELQLLQRPDLKIVIMSATINAKPLSDYFNGAPIIQSPGKVFPLKIHHSEKSQILNTGMDFMERFRKMVVQAYNTHPEGDILCFLPGRGEIQRLSKDLDSLFMGKAVVASLHGQLDLREQRKALVPDPKLRKIILATNIAESSLTVQGVRVVVDSGLERLQSLNAKTGFESLQLVRISKASATQRAGRAAREAEGVVYRAWSVHDERSMEEFTTPEIRRVDLSETLLMLSAFGIHSFDSFSWFEAPLPRSLARARHFLKNINALDDSDRLTPLGERLRTLPVHPRIGQLLLSGELLGVPVLASELAVLLSEKIHRTKYKNHGAENDLLASLEEWRADSGQDSFKYWNRMRDQWLGLLKKKEDLLPMSEDLIETLLFSAYEDRVCRRRRKDCDEAKMVGGRGVKVHADSTVKDSEYFLALDISDGDDSSFTKVFRAIGLSLALVDKRILQQAKVEDRIEWDDEQQKFWSIESLTWKGLSVGQDSRRPAHRDKIQQALVDVAYDKWNWIVTKNSAFSNWLSRIHFLHQSAPRWPVLTDEQKREGLELCCYGEDSLKSLEDKDLIGHFKNLLSSDHMQALDKECPAYWVAPTGNRFMITYNLEQGPSVEVRLQEVFSVMQTPSIAGVPLTLVLLAPNYRPVQVTRDIRSFWDHAYKDVRKEMRARYPKHAWPEDPLSALPQAKGRPRKT